MRVNLISYGIKNQNLNFGMMTKAAEGKLESSKNSKCKNCRDNYDLVETNPYVAVYVRKGETKAKVLKNTLKSLKGAPKAKELYYDINKKLEARNNKMGSLCTLAVQVRDAESMRKKELGRKFDSGKNYCTHGRSTT